MQKQYNDAAVLKKLKSGKQMEIDAALRLLYKSHYNMVENIVLKNNGTQAEAMDIFHKGLIRLHNEVLFNNLQLNYPVQAYLYAECRNLWADYSYKNNLQNSFLETEEFTVQEENNFCQLIESERSQSICGMFEKLGDDCKRLLLLFYFEKLSIDEITKKMELSTPENTHIKKSRCIQKLRSLIQAQNGNKSILQV